MDHEDQCRTVSMRSAAGDYHGKESSRPENRSKLAEFVPPPGGGDSGTALQTRTFLQRKGIFLTAELAFRRFGSIAKLKYRFITRTTIFGLLWIKQIGFYVPFENIVSWKISAPGRRVLSPAETSPSSAFCLIHARMTNECFSWFYFIITRSLLF